MPETSFSGGMSSSKATYDIGGKVLRKDWQVTQYRYMRRVFCIPSIQEVTRQDGEHPWKPHTLD